MCGITGIVDSSLSQAGIAAALDRMNDAIIHRGPDDSGRVAVNGRGIGMRRLSIIDLAGGKQPIANETGDIHVVCNGEIYNHVELRESLKGQGHRFETHSDAEVVVHLYEQYGDDCLTRLRGMFGSPFGTSDVDASLSRGTEWERNPCSTHNEENVSSSGRR